MPRAARLSSRSGIYHVMARGISREHIFLDDSDRRVYLDLLKRVTEEAQLTIYGFCLMDTHVHLLLKEGPEPLSTCMQRLNLAYAVGFNKKYDRNGYLFQGRFRSEPVEDDAYFLTVLRYIHQNPVQAGLVRNCASFFWSSYQVYAFDKGPVSMINTAYAFDLIGGQDRFLTFTNAANGDSCMDMVARVSDHDIRSRINQLLDDLGVTQLSALAPKERDGVLRKIKGMEGASIRQIARLAGIGKGVVERA